MILGTAGHIDHGKTALVRALTGVDTDRLPEEKRRGITIELGFAPLTLEGIGPVSIVDVPGHEAFVRTMLAGATGVDLALLVVAADEGVMPQTREHVAILQLLGVRAGVVALTKCDLVEDPDWLALVREDVRALLAATALADAPIVETSATTGAGLDALRRALSERARDLPARSADDLFRLPVDRAFSVRGTGTVVTGTVWSGSLARDASVRVWPADRVVRVRVLQTHGAQVQAVTSGQRAALGLVGVEVGDVPRGSVLVAGDGWQPSSVLRADVALLDEVVRSLGPRTAVRFHLGTAEVGARLVVAGGRLAAGAVRSVRVVLDEAVVARAGDRFVLRTASPTATIGGGVVTDPAPPRRARPWPVEADAPARLELALLEAGARGLPFADLPVRFGVPAPDVPRLLAALKGRVHRLGERLFAAAEVARLGAEVTSVVTAFHASEPLEPGMPLQLLRSRIAAPPELVDEIVRRGTAAGRLEVDGALIRLGGWSAAAPAADRALADALLARLTAAGAEPPSVGELAPEYGVGTIRVLRFLEREGRVVAVESDRYYERGAHESLLARLRAAMADGSERSPAELREILGVSRKYLIPLLEHCDRVGYTARRGS
ncbi:MAG TPA: selenocysteine-specific translation elongation factor, partial [Gemmatimonadaceae bacterium]|nr:selenocysteine-specific translation elongation factor [Gemmatimonadaceae bacterium]